MMNKILLFLACFFGVTAIILGFWCNLQSGRIDSLKSAKTMLESNNNFLIKKIEREHNDKVELGRKNQELENLAKRSVGFDWNRDISSDVIILKLKEYAESTINQRQK